MEDPKFEVKIPVVKPKKEISIDTQTNTLNRYSVIDDMNKNRSNSESPDYVKVIKETNICEGEKHILSDSTLEKMQPESIKSLDTGMKYPTLQVKENNSNRTVDDEREDTNSRSIKFKGFANVHQTNAHKNKKYDSSLSSSRKNEFEATICESPEHSKEIYICENDLVSKCESSQVEIKSPNPSTSVDNNLKQLNDECFGENCKKESVAPNAEQMQTTMGTLSLKPTAEEIDPFFTEFIRKLTLKLLLILSASRESKSGSEIKWQKCPKKRSANINMCESTGSMDEEFNSSSIKFIRHMKQKFTGCYTVRQDQFGSEKKWQKCSQETSANINVAGSKDSKIAQGNLCHTTKSGIADDSKRKRIFDEEDRRCMRTILFLFEDTENDQSEKELERALEAFNRRVPQIIKRATALREDEINSHRTKNEENNETVKQRSPTIKRRNATQYTEICNRENYYTNEKRLKTEKQNSEALLNFHLEANKDSTRHAPQQQELEALLHEDDQIASPKNRDGQTYGQTIRLSEEIVLEHRSQNCQTQTLTINSKSTKETDRGQSCMGRKAHSKNQSIPTKFINETLEEKECMNGSICKGKEARQGEILLEIEDLATAREEETANAPNQAILTKSITEKLEKKESMNDSIYKEEVPRCDILFETEEWAAARREEVANTKKLIEQNLSNVGKDVSTDDDGPLIEENIVQGTVAGVSERVVEHVSENLTELEGKRSNESTLVYTRNKCKEFLGHLQAVLDNNIQVNVEMLFEDKILDFEVLHYDLTDLERRLDKIIKPMQELVKYPNLKSGANDDIYIPEKVVVLYTITSIIESIAVKLRVIYDQIVIRGADENRLKGEIGDVVIKFHEINEKIILIQEMVIYSGNIASGSRVRGLIKTN